MKARAFICIGTILIAVLVAATTTSVASAAGTAGKIDCTTTQLTADGLTEFWCVKGDAKVVMNGYSVKIESHDADSAVTVTASWSPNAPVAQQQWDDKECVGLQVKHLDTHHGAGTAKGVFVPSYDFNEYVGTSTDLAQGANPLCGFVPWLTDPVNVFWRATISVTGRVNLDAKLTDLPQLQH